MTGVGGVVTADCMVVTVCVNGVAGMPVPATGVSTPFMSITAHECKLVAYTHHPHFTVCLRPIWTFRPDSCRNSAKRHLWGHFCTRGCTAPTRCDVTTARTYPHAWYGIIVSIGYIRPFTMRPLRLYVASTWSTCPTNVAQWKLTLWWSHRRRCLLHARRHFRLLWWRLIHHTDGRCLHCVVSYIYCFCHDVMYKSMLRNMCNLIDETQTNMS